MDGALDLYELWQNRFPRDSSSLLLTEKTPSELPSLPTFVLRRFLTALGQNLESQPDHGGEEVPVFGRASEAAPPTISQGLR